MMVTVRFRTTVLLGGKTATGIEVPADVVEALGAAKRPKVTVSLGGHTYRTTISPRGGQFLVPLSAENRAAAGLAAGDDLEVDIALDDAPRVVDVPADLQAALSTSTAAREFFDSLSYTHRKEWVRWITEAKKEETRASRVVKTLAALAAGKRTH
jgi:antitoxin component of MazEF toxin-antitoxin module